MTSFRRDFYDRYDLPTKLAFSGRLVSNGWTVTEGTTYGTDLWCEHPITGLFLETEVKRLRCWGSGQAFPMATITIANRKEHVAHEGGWFGVSNTWYTDAVMISPGAFLAGRVIWDDRGRGMEAFREIPVVKCKEIKL